MSINVLTLHTAAVLDERITAGRSVVVLLVVVIAAAAGRHAALRTERRVVGHVMLTRDPSVCHGRHASVRHAQVLRRGYADGWRDGFGALHQQMGTSRRRHALMLVVVLI